MTLRSAAFLVFLLAVAAFAAGAHVGSSGTHAGLLDTGKHVGLPYSGKHVGLPDAGKHVGLPYSGTHAGLLDTGKHVGLPYSGKHVGLPYSGKHVGLPHAGKHVGLPDAGKHVGLLDTGKHVGSLDTGKHVGLPYNGTGGGVPNTSPGRRQHDIELVPDSVLRYNVLVTWYGNPHTPKMGILGEYTGAELAKGLSGQATAYQGATTKRVQAAYELVAIVAQGTPGADGLWRRRESTKVIDAMLAEARAQHFKLVLDVQVGHSTVKSELAYLRKYLEEPDVYLALDPEFHMWEGQQPGHVIGHTLADDINYSIDLLHEIIAGKKLPPKVLIVHQFTMNMLPDKERVKDSRLVDVALCMDGWGDRPLKLATYRMVTRKPLEYAAIKLFYRKDGDMLAPAEALRLEPTPAVVIYQ